MRIRIEGCSGLNKVAMTKAIRDNSSLKLKPAMAYTDKLLEQGFLEFEIDDSWDKESLLMSLELANANVVSVVVDDN